MRNILLDTHLFLWSQFEKAKLSSTILHLLRSRDVRWHASQVSVLEIQIKHDLGKLELPASPERIIPQILERSGFAFAPISNQAIFMLAKLPTHHRDPFDRLMIATALVNGWEIATVDRVFDDYPVRTVR